MRIKIINVDNTKYFASKKIKCGCSKPKPVITLHRLNSFSKKKNTFQFE